MTINDLNDCISEMPEALIAVSSLLSPRLPNVISEDSKMASGRAWGTIINPKYQKNWARISIERPFPINSSIERQTYCIITTN